MSVSKTLIMLQIFVGLDECLPKFHFLIFEFYHSEWFDGLIKGCTFLWISDQ